MAGYVEYKDSGIQWISEVPAHWDIQRGKNVLTLLDRPVKNDDEVITCFRDGEVTLRKNRREDGFTVSFQEIGYQGIEPGDLVVHGMDGFAGAIGVSDSRGKATPVLNVMDSMHNKRFLMYYLRMAAYKDVFMSLSTGIRVRSCDLRWNKLSVFPFILPERQEQDKIVEYIDDSLAKIDDIIAEAKASIEEYKAWKASIIYEAVTKGLDPNVEMKDSGIDIIGIMPSHWETCRLKYLCDVMTGNHDTQNADDNGEYPFYVRSPIVQKANVYTYEGEGILMAGDGAGAGRIFHHAFGKYAIHQRVYCFHNFRNINTDYYLYFISELFKKVMDKGSAQSTVPSVRLPMIQDFVFCIPPEEEQKMIVEHLEERCSNIDALISGKEALITDLESYKKALIFEVVTGKRRVC